MPTSPTGTSTDQNGFTLVELVVVIVILSLVGLITMPLLVGRIGGDDRTMVRRLAGTVKELYNEATLTRDEHQLVFDLDRNSLQTFRMRSHGNRSEKESFRGEVFLSPLTLRQIDVEGQGSFRSGQVTVRVFPLGWMEQTRVLVRRDDGSDSQLSFSPLTGSISIDEPQSAVR